MMRRCVFLFALLCAPVHAAQQCVAFGDLSDSLYVAGVAQTDWMLYNDSITVRGIAVCAMTAGDYADVTDSLEYDTVFYPSEIGYYDPLELLDKNSNYFCWCRMLKPAVSSWIAYGPLVDAEECVNYCAEDCVGSIIGDSNFVSTMLKSLVN